MFTEKLNSMTSPLEIKADDPLIKQIKFKTYRYTTRREANQLLPDSDETQSKVIKTPWDGELTARSGDYLVHEQDDPDDQWVVEKDIFEDTYETVEPGTYVKKATVELVPLTQIAPDPDQEVKIYSLEGVLTVRAGDYYLAKGSQEELWPIPREKVEQSMEPVDEGV